MKLFGFLMQNNVNAQEWDNQIMQYAPQSGAFLQSWTWGEFEKSLGRTVERISQAGDNGVMYAQAMRRSLPLGRNYWYMPKGPVGSAPIEQMTKWLKDTLPSGVFLRMEPSDGGRMQRVKDRQPSATTLLDLTVGEEMLLKQMKSKTRYNIRLSTRKGVYSEFGDKGSIDDFMRLMDQTTARDQFQAHPRAYYEAMIERLQSETLKTHIAIAYGDDRPIAANMVVDFAGTRTYLHGATSNLHRNLMPQYHLHWFLIQDAIKRGLHTFDFWGIAPPDADASHPLQGVTRYKLGYQGDVVQMPGTFDLSSQFFWYNTYRLARKIRNIRR